MIKTKHLKLELFRWLKRLCIRFRWDRGYLFFAGLVFKEIVNVYGPQSPYPWTRP